MNDNRTYQVYNLIDEIADNAGFLTLQSDLGHQKIYDSSEDMALIKKYCNKFGSSKLTGNLARRVYRKQ